MKASAGIFFGKKSKLFPPCIYFYSYFFILLAFARKGDGGGGDIRHRETSWRDSGDKRVASHSTMAALADYNCYNYYYYDSAVLFVRPESAGCVLLSAERCPCCCCCRCYYRLYTCTVLFPSKEKAKYCKPKWGGGG